MSYGHITVHSSFQCFHHDCRRNLLAFLLYCSLVEDFFSFGAGRERSKVSRCCLSKTCFCLKCHEESDLQTNLCQPNGVFAVIEVKMFLIQLSLQTKEKSPTLFEFGFFMSETRGWVGPKSGDPNLSKQRFQPKFSSELQKTTTVEKGKQKRSFNIGTWRLETCKQKKPSQLEVLESQ